MVEKTAGGHGAEAAKERKGLWSPEEDERLYARITRHGVSTWSSVAQLAGLRRSGKSCRLRWMNYLRPDLKKEPISKREQDTIVSLQKSLGNRWSVIAARMPGRTDNEIKNYWNSRIRKRQSVVLTSSGDGGGANGDPPAAAAAETQHELALAESPAGEKKEPFSAAAAPPAVPPARFPVFACQIPAGSAINAAPQSTTTTAHEHNGAGSESEVSVGGGEEHCYYYYRGGDGDMDMFGHLLSFDDLEYPAAGAAGGDLLMDAWESQLYCANSGGSSVD
ncbi:transcription factor MYB4 [Brachypodium distachyon]|uniref:Uncharacterized protein n=1 Tax=Brachypodium distachyon TaxID=15368 RepID=A0A0Q3FXC0_BRADI|nr:transcription factor MYB4 [Brachypodium distachyon]KQK02877.1 hypothetical protein BRADI_2g04252v3 [Brachypodium distachyon]|eukprot:XP_010232989.1 transcription factor MYB4 [Brachypodium distachyon]